MKSGSIANGTLKRQISIDMLKKAMEVEAREVLSLLQNGDTHSSSTPKGRPSDNISALTGLGRNIDMKG